MTDDTIVYLVVQSYAGIGIHYYGYLRGDSLDSRIDLDYPLTPSQAAKFNKQEPGYKGGYHAGDKSGRFMTVEHLEKAATKVYKDHFPNAILLLKGSPVLGGPKWVLDGPEDVFVSGRLLWLDAEELGWWDHEPEIMDEISDKWDELISPYKPIRVGQRATPITELVEEDQEETIPTERPKQTIDEWYEENEHREITLTVRARTTFNEKTGTGFLNFYMAVCDVSDEDGDEIGSIKADTTASIWLSRTGEKSWRIGADDLWYAFIEALEEENDA